MTDSRPHDAAALADMIARALEVADRLGYRHVGIDLNAALERLTGRGVVPIEQDLDERDPRETCPAVNAA